MAKTFNVVLTGCDPHHKLPVVKAVKESLGIGLKEAKDKVDATDVISVNLKEGVSEDEAAKLKTVIEKAGGIVEIIQQY